MAESEAVAPRNRKLSEVIAAQLMQQIRDMGWPVGESLGTEAELMSRFQVSRATIVEAIRQIEGYGAAVMRRGSGGGLVITSSAKTALSRAIATYLEFATVTVLEQYEAILLIETEAVRLAAKNVLPDQFAVLRRNAAELTECEDNVAFHKAAMQLRLAIADSSGSYPVMMFMRSLVRMLTHYVRPDLRNLHRDRDFEYGMAADLAAIVEAIIAGNDILAAEYVRKEVKRREQRARELAVSRPELSGGPLRPDSPNKLAEQVAFSIREEIARTGRRPGERLGDESDLPERFGVSPWVLRQAVRVLEPLGIVTVRRGQAGGMYVGKASPEHTIEMAISYLKAYRDSTGIKLDTYVDMHRSMMEYLAQCAATRSSQEEREHLMALADSGRPGQFWSAMSLMSKNQILDLFAAILNRFITSNEDAPRFDASPAELAGIANAVLDGDGAVARRRTAMCLGAPYKK